MTPETSGETKAAESEKKDTVCVVTVNGETVELTGKEDYIFVDVLTGSRLISTPETDVQLQRL